MRVYQRNLKEGACERNLSRMHTANTSKDIIYAYPDTEMNE